MGPLCHALQSQMGHQLRNGRCKSSCGQPLHLWELSIHSSLSGARNEGFGHNRGNVLHVEARARMAGSLLEWPKAHAHVLTTLTTTKYENSTDLKMQKNQSTQYQKNRQTPKIKKKTRKSGHDHAGKDKKSKISQIPQNHKTTKITKIKKHNKNRQIENPNIGNPLLVLQQHFRQDLGLVHAVPRPFPCHEHPRSHAVWRSCAAFHGPSSDPANLAAPAAKLLQTIASGDTRMFR